MSNFDIKIVQPKRIEKSWGYELWIHNDSQYCGKLLVFNKVGDRFSMHYHMLKTESWYVHSGSFEVNWIDTKNGEKNHSTLQVGDTIYVQKGLPHQLIALEDNSTIFEVSTQHFDDDSYRIYIKSPFELLDAQ